MHLNGSIPWVPMTAGVFAVDAGEHLKIYISLTNQAGWWPSVVTPHVPPFIPVFYKGERSPLYPHALTLLVWNLPESFFFPIPSFQ